MSQDTQLKTDFTPAPGKAIAVLDTRGRIAIIIPLPCEMSLFGRLLMTLPDAEILTCESNLQNGSFQWTPEKTGELDPLAKAGLPSSA